MGSQDKLAIEGRKADTAICKDESGTRLNNACIGKLDEEVKSIREHEAIGKGGILGNPSKLPSPSQAALAEWMVANGGAKDKSAACSKVKTWAINRRRRQRWTSSNRSSRVDWWNRLMLSDSGSAHGGNESSGAGDRRSNWSGSQIQSSNHEI